MAFLNFFRAQLPNILINLKTIKIELAKTQSDLERLFIMEQNYAVKKVNADQYDSLLEAAIFSFGIAMWMTDDNGRFIFANKICCDTILKCPEEEISDITFCGPEKDALAIECLKSDKIVMRKRKTMRFIAHVVYPKGKDIFLDVTKSPRRECGEIIGTICTGIVITDNIPKGIRDQKRLSNSIEIPVNASMGTRKLIELLERRKFSRKKSNGKKYQKYRKHS